MGPVYALSFHGVLLVATTVGSNGVRGQDQPEKYGILRKEKRY